jgi:hypothetical protein
VASFELDTGRVDPASFGASGRGCRRVWPPDSIGLWLGRAGVDYRRLSWIAFWLAMLVFLLSLAAGRYGDDVLFLYIVPLMVGVAAAGLRGGLAFALLGSVVSVVWWARQDFDWPITWPISRVLAMLVVGALAGVLVDSSRRLASELAHERELSLDVIGTLDLEGRFTRVSPSVRRVLGHAPDEAVSHRFLD